MGKSASRKDSKGRVLNTGESEVEGKGYKYRYVDRNKKRRTVYAPNLPALRKKESKIKLDLNDGIDCVNASITTLNDEFDVFIKTKNNIRITTRNRYIGVWNYHIRNTPLGKSRVANIKQSAILLFLTTLRDRGYKNSTIRIIGILLIGTFELAVKDDLIRKNPAKGCLKGFPNVTSKDRRALTLDEQVTYLNYIKSSMYQKYLPLIITLLGTGCRISELLGLTWNDIDFKNDVIVVNKQLIHKRDGKDENMYRIEEPKSDSGIRIIPIKPEVREILSKYKSEMYFTSINSGCVVDGYSGFVFTSKTGFVMNDKVLYKTLTRISANIRKKGNPEFPVVSAHILRHTACTRMAEQKMDMNVLRDIMGHKNIDMIVKVYDTIHPERVKEEVGKLNKIAGL